MPAPPRNVSSSLDLRGVLWLRSSHSTGMNNCIETGLPRSGPWAGLLAVRDSKDPAGPALLFSPGSWAGFTAALRS